MEAITNNYRFYNFNYNNFKIITLPLFKPNKGHTVTSDL